MNTRLIAVPAALAITLASLPLFHVATPVAPLHATPITSPRSPVAPSLRVVNLEPVVVHPTAADRAAAGVR